MTSINDLPHDDQVALWAGRIVRLEAEIESMLKVVYYYLCGEGLSFLIVPDFFAPLVAGVKKMIKAAEIPEDYRADCVAALDRLSAAHQLRNRIVHDQ